MIFGGIRGVSCMLKGWQYLFYSLHNFWISEISSATMYTSECGSTPSSTSFCHVLIPETWTLRNSEDLGALIIEFIKSPAGPEDVVKSEVNRQGC